MGLRATRSQLLAFKDTLLPRTTVAAAGPGQAEPDRARACLAVDRRRRGGARGTVAHAGGRVIPTTGKPVAELQWVQFDVADAPVSPRPGAGGRTMWLADHGRPKRWPPPSRRSCTPTRSPRIAELGLRIGGASGYLRTSPIQRHFRDAQAGALMAYSVELCRDTVGKAVLGTAAD